MLSVQPPTVSLSVPRSESQPLFRRSPSDRRTQSAPSLLDAIFHSKRNSASNCKLQRDIEGHRLQFQLLVSDVYDEVISQRTAYRTVPGGLTMCAATACTESKVRNLRNVRRHAYASLTR